MGDHTQPLTLGELVVDNFLATVVGNDGDLEELVALLQPDPARDVGDGRLVPRNTGLEQLLHARQTTDDVGATGNTTLVEGTHGQLSTGLTDGLGGDDADGLADVDQLAGGHRAAVALGTHTGGRGAGQHGADLHLR